MSRTISQRRRQTPAKFSRTSLLHYRVLVPEGLLWKGGNIPKGELLTVKSSSQYILVSRWHQAGLIVRESKPLEGMCQECGCTWSRACHNGCSWTSERRTLCSRCQGREK